MEFLISTVNKKINGITKKARSLIQLESRKEDFELIWKLSKRKED